MILTRRAALGTKQLDEAHDAIVIRGMEPGRTEKKVGTAQRMNGSGSRVTSRNFSMVEAKVTFAINIKKYELEARREAFDAACAWALRKGWLTLTENPGRRLYVNEVVLPEAGDLWDWTKDYTIGLQAYDVPYWQDAEPEAVIANTISNGSLTVPVNGHVNTVLDATFENKSGKTINKLELTADGNKFTFTDLGLGGSDTMTISHGTNGILQIKIGSTSVLAKRTGADDLIMRPGNRTVTISAERAGKLTLIAAGRYIA